MTIPSASERPAAGVRVLLSPAVTASHAAELADAFPGVTFTPLTPRAGVPAGAEDAVALLRVGLGKPQLSAVLAAAPALRWVHTSTAGFDWAWVPEIPARGIALTRSAAAYAYPIGEFTLAVVSALVKGLPLFAAAQRERLWLEHEPLDLAGLRVGVIGAGAIGTEIAWRAAALGMRLRGLKRHPGPLEHFEHVHGPGELLELLGWAQVAVVACPLTPETRGLVGAAELAAMPRGSYLVNVARGGIVDAGAVVVALESGHLAGAALDAFDVEPLPPTDPLWEAPNLLITPHTSFRSPGNLARVVAEFRANLGRFLAGEELLNTMRHPELGY